MQLGNTFQGEIHEFPGVFVDRFNGTGEVYLLTHCHQDHLQGLLNNSFCGRVYCSALTKSTLELDTRYIHASRFFKVKEYNETFAVETLLGKVTITMIPSYHCPGSSMFLLESSTKSVLITGDVRAESWWTSSLIKNPHLFPYITGLRTLDQLYLDTTFSYRGEPYIYIMPNSEGIFAAIELLKLYPFDSDLSFSFVDSVSGSEEAWIQIARYFNGSLVTNGMLQKRIELYKNSLNLRYAVISLSEKSPVFKVGNTPDSTPIIITIKQIINLNAMEYASQFLPRNICEIDLSSASSLVTTKNGHQIYMLDGRKWLLPKGGSELLPTCIPLMFSRHSSYQESRSLVALFSPKLVYPCTESKMSWLNGFTVARVFGDVCTNTEADHRFDIDRFQKFGYPLPEVINREVAFISKWSLSQCVDETEMSKTVIERPFRGQLQPLYNNPNKRLCQSHFQKFSLPYLIAQRDQESLKQAVKYHQNLHDYAKFGHRSSSSYGSVSSSKESLPFSENESSEANLLTNSTQNDSALTCIDKKKPPDILNNKKIAELTEMLTNDRRNWTKFHLKCINSNIN